MHQHVFCNTTLKCEKKERKKERSNKTVFNICWLAVCQSSNTASICWISWFFFGFPFLFFLSKIERLFLVSHCSWLLPLFPAANILQRSVEDEHCIAFFWWRSRPRWRTRIRFCSTTGLLESSRMMRHIRSYSFYRGIPSCSNESFCNPQRLLIIELQAILTLFLLALGKTELNSSIATKNIKGNTL